ncbi:MAG: anti-sigma factor family protein [Lysobacter sp.]
MNKVPEETLMAYVDGELESGAADAVEQAMRESPEIAAAVERARALRNRMHAAYASVLEEPIPARLLDAASGPATAGAGAHVQQRSGTRRASNRRRWGGREWSAIAASLVLGAVVVGGLRPGGGSETLQLTDNGMVATGTLAQALDTRLSGPMTAGVALGVGFRADDGYCRTFGLEPAAGSAHALAGLACRDARGWRVVALGETAPSGEALRQAAVAIPPGVLSEVDARLGDGEPLDAAGERAALHAGWRVPRPD